MTHKIDSLSKKLKDLQGQQQALEAKLSTQLYQEIQAILGDQFSPSLTYIDID
jgi:outer membrane murein-binding lipoprotein Lpp